MNLIDRIRVEFAYASSVREACDRWGELQQQYYLHPCHSPERRAVGEQIAVCLAVIADGLDGAKLPRVFAWFDPEGLRRDAEGWRNGDDMSGEECCPHDPFAYDR